MAIAKAAGLEAARATEIKRRLKNATLRFFVGAGLSRDLKGGVCRRVAALSLLFPHIPNPRRDARAPLVGINRSVEIDKGRAGILPAARHGRDARATWHRRLAHFKGMLGEEQA